MPKHVYRLVAGLLLAIAQVALAAGEAEDARRPDRFAIIFNKGYAGDNLPKDPASFERLIRVIREAHFNTVMGKYEEWRARICKKYEIRFFVDLLVPETHVYQNVEAAHKLCESLRKSDVVYGYHLWSDNIASTYDGRSRDVKNVHAWDPTHPTYVGSYRMDGVARVQGSDLFGYYDFHWKRGGHWEHLVAASKVAREKGAHFLRYCDAAPGRVGTGNPNRVGYTIATSIPFGLKGYLFHYTGGVVDEKSGQLDALGKDLKVVNAKFAAIGDEVMAIGNPTAVYSTPVTKTAKDEAVDGAPAVPGGLAAIPADHPFRIAHGEVLLGVFKDPKGREVIALASHNAYQPQDVRIEFKESPKAVSFFNRATRKWTSLRLTAGAASFQVEEYATELVRIER